VAIVRMRAKALIDNCYPDAHTKDAWAKAQWKYSADIHMIAATNPVYLYTVEESRNVPQPFDLMTLILSYVANSINS
jgi:hypothetical protein